MVRVPHEWNPRRQDCISFGHIYRKRNRDFYSLIEPRVLDDQHGEARHIWYVHPIAARSPSKGSKRFLLGVDALKNIIVVDFCLTIFGYANCVWARVIYGSWLIKGEKVRTLLRVSQNTMASQSLHRRNLCRASSERIPVCIDWLEWDGKDSDESLG